MTETLEPTAAKTAALALIDAGLAAYAAHSIASTAEVCDLLLDLRQLVAGLDG